jgi:rare lipoprotein A
LNCHRMYSIERVARSATWLMLLLLTACSGWRSAPTSKENPVQSQPSVTPTQPTLEPLSRYGNPAFYDVFGKRYFPLKSAAGFSERGVASWYGPDFHGGLTSTRESYDMYQMTAAHKVLPLPSWVEVTNISNGRKVQVRVNDRGPFKDNRIIDLSYAAALQLDMVRAGTALVEIRALTEAGAAPSTAQSTSVSQRELFLQLGAFSERTNAERMKDQLETKFSSGVSISPEPATAPKMYKVRIGPLQDVAATDQALATLDAMGISEHQFVTNGAASEP